MLLPQGAHIQDQYTALWPTRCSRRELYSVARACKATRQPSMSQNHHTMCYCSQMILIALCPEAFVRHSAMVLQGSLPRPTLPSH
jgi:hypothetical protein